jgi:signal transduction histidine kinase/ligand-binding sensor domain-containing protein/DNA-binding response OmpR family regulator
MSLLSPHGTCLSGRPVSRIAPVARVVAFASLFPWLITAGANGQALGAPSWVHESWTIKDGLPVNSINTIIQDRQGYIWAATFDGLVRFDGIRFTVFNSANSEQLPSNRIIQLKEARDGSLWLMTEQGHIVRFRRGQFTIIPFDGGAGGPEVRTLFEDSVSGLWVGTSAGLWTLRRDRLVRVGRGTLDTRVTAIAKRRDGSLAVGTSGAGVFRVLGDRVTKLAANRDLDADYITRFFEDTSGTLYVGGVRALWRWRDQLTRVKGTPLPFQVENLELVRATGDVFISSASGTYRIIGDSAVRVRAASPNAGLKLWADSTAIWNVDGQVVVRDTRPVFRLADNRLVSSAMFDREGSLWLGTDASGLHRLKPAIFTAYSTPEGVGHPNVYSVYADRSGAIWLGTWGNGATRLDPATGRGSVVRPPAMSIEVNSFYEAPDSVLWVAGSAEAGSLRACALASMTCHLEGPRELRDRAVFALYGDADGRLWAGAAGLLFRYDGRTWTSFPASSDGPAASVRVFASTRDGALWMGTNGGGLARYRDGQFTRVTRSDGLPSDLIRSLYQDTDGWLWVGTEGRGLVRLDPRAWGASGATAKGAIVRIGTKDGLFDEVIHQILADDDDRLWMNTNRGIFWVPRAELNAFADGKATRIHSTAYTERDGMRNREGNGGVQPAGAKGRDGRLWFPTQDGVVVVDPTKVRRERLTPPVVVEQAVAAGATLRPERDSIELRAGQRDVQIEYTALTLLEPTNVRFRYRLDPYDAAWVDVGNRRTAFYTKVPPGRYTFRVEASDAAGGWYEPGTSLAVRVLPTFWETAAFRWISAITLGVGLLLAVRWREARLRARAMGLERVVGDRTAALRERERELADRNAQLQSLDHAKTRFFANVSHELRTPLTLTIGPLEDLRARAGGDPQVERWLDIALRNSRRLLRLVNQILDVAKLDAGAMHLAPRPIDLGPFTRGVVGAFSPVAERKNIRLTVDTPDTLRGTFDADAVEKILTNLVSNAIKFTPAGGSVHVALSPHGDGVRLLVRDSGPGIPHDEIGHVFERFYQVDESTTRSQPGTGIGLSLVKELVELHGGTIEVESSGEGTTFSATIPARPAAAGVAEQPAATITDNGSLAPVTEEQPASDALVPNSDTRSDDVPTLLVVDDSADLRTYIRGHFSAQFRVIEAHDGAEGIALAREHMPDVVLSDVMMPNADGHELVRTLRGSPETDFLSIVLLTAQAEDTQRFEGLEGGADDYIVKPFEMRELDVRVRNLITRRRRLRERFSTHPTPATADTSTIAPVDHAYAVRVRAAIQRGLADPGFGVEELADAVSQDRSHMFRRVKDVFGESPSDLIRRMRLEEGARLLAEGSGTVSDVAYAVGFNSLSHFCRRFIEVYAVTPATYRATGSRGQSR